MGADFMVFQRALIYISDSTKCQSISWKNFPSYTWNLCLL